LHALLEPRFITIAVDTQQHEWLVSKPFDKCTLMGNHAHTRLAPSAPEDKCHHLALLVAGRKNGVKEKWCQFILLDAIGIHW
jgi:hypothetical protein